MIQKTSDKWTSRTGSWAALDRIGQAKTSVTKFSYRDHYDLSYNSSDGRVGMGQKDCSDLAWYHEIREIDSNDIEWSLEVLC